MSINLFSDLKFEKAVPGEEEASERLFRSAFDPYVRLLGRELSINAYDWLPDSIKAGNVWLAIQEGKMVGAVAIIPEGDTWSIDQVAVSPEMQGQGVGTEMLSSIEVLARNQGIIKLSLDTARMMTDLIRLYKKLGFRIINEGKPKHGKDSHVRVFMEKALR